MGWGKPAWQVSSQSTGNQEAGHTLIKVGPTADPNGKGRLEGSCSPLHFAEDTNLQKRSATTIIKGESPNACPACMTQRQEDPKFKAKLAQLAS